SRTTSIGAWGVRILLSSGRARRRPSPEPGNLPAPAGEHRHLAAGLPVSAPARGPFSPRGGTPPPRRRRPAPRYIARGRWGADPPAGARARRVGIDSGPGTGRVG